MKIFFLITSLTILSNSAWADIDSMKARIPQVVELKEQGKIGEQPDGYLGVVEASPEASKIVAEENSDRKEEYAKRAAAKGQKVEELAVVLGTARIRDEKAGRFVRKTDGSWTKK